MKNLKEIWLVFIASIMFCSSVMTCMGAYKAHIDKVSQSVEWILTFMAVLFTGIFLVHLKEYLKS